MSCEYSIEIISSWFVDILEQFGEVAFDAYWDSGYPDMEEGEFWSKDNLDRYLSPQDIDLYQNVLGDLLIPFLIEGQKINQCPEYYNKGDSFDGKFIHFTKALLGGSRSSWNMNPNFVSKIISAKDFIPINKDLILINELIPQQKLKDEGGWYASFLTPQQVKTINNLLPQILEDNFDFRWLLFENNLINNNRYYYHSYLENSSWVIQEENRWQEIEINPEPTFTNIFTHPNCVREFLNDTLIPLYQKTSEKEEGILICIGW